MENTRSLLLFFIDGLGIGTRGPHNPFDGLTDTEPLAIFQNEIPDIPFEGLLTATDARRGVEGRPQSASGQTTILTGINAPAALRAHQHAPATQPALNISRQASVVLDTSQSSSP